MIPTIAISHVLYVFFISKKNFHYKKSVRGRDIKKNVPRAAKSYARAKYDTAYMHIYNHYNLVPT